MDARRIVPGSVPNAFATGRNPENAAVAVNTGLLDLMSEEEVAGVIAHELAHIRHRDTLIMTITATLAGAIGMLAQFGFLFGGRTQDGRQNPFGPIGALLLVIVGPLAAMLVQMAVSCSREYQADASGAALSQDPLALASALRKIAAGAAARPLPQEDRLVTQSHLMIANPFRGQGLASMFTTHPPMPERIARLEQMARDLGQP